MTRAATGGIRRRPLVRSARAALVLLLAACAVPSRQARASTDDPPQDPAAAKAPVKLVTLDLAVPDSPTFALLGLSPEAVVRPSSPRDLATTVLNGVDRRGNLQSGLAVDFAPLFLFAGKTLTHERYRDSRATQLYARTQISLATAKGSGDGDQSLRLAFGVRATLWDAGDPRLDPTLDECLSDIPIPPPETALLTQADRDAYVAAATAERRPAVEGCHKAFAARRWNASSFAVGVAPSWQSPTGESRDFQYAGAAVWTSLALALSRTEEVGGGPEADRIVRPYGQLVVQGRYRNKELVPDKDVEGVFFEQDSAAMALRLVLGRENVAGVVESEVARTFPVEGDGGTSFMLSVGGQVRLGTGVWLSLSVGGNRAGSDREQGSAFVLSSLKWALSREPAIEAPGGPR